MPREEFPPATPAHPAWARQGRAPAPAIPVWVAEGRSTAMRPSTGLMGLSVAGMGLRVPGACGVDEFAAYFLCLAVGEFFPFLRVPLRPCMYLEVMNWHAER